MAFVQGIEELLDDGQLVENFQDLCAIHNLEGHNMEMAQYSLRGCNRLSMGM